MLVSSDSGLMIVKRRMHKLKVNKTLLLGKRKCSIMVDVGGKFYFGQILSYLVSFQM